MTAPPPELLARFAAIVGAKNALTGANAIAPYLSEPRGRYAGRTPMVLRAGSVAEVAAVLKLADATHTGIVPQGGNTGLVGGQTPSERGDELILSLSRLNRIRGIDGAGDAITVEAGCILADVQAAADAADRRFPLSLASEGSCEIGGNLATNAGGTAVLAYGTARSLTLGLEVVLASGEVWDGLRSLHKDNTGYDLRDLFIGSEGTLGVITAAVLRLVARPKGVAVAILGVPSPAAAVSVLGIARADGGGGLTACEIMPRFAIETVLRHVGGTRDPLPRPHAWYVLAEISSPRSQNDADATLDQVYAAASDGGLVEDGVRALSADQARAFWRIRHALSEVQKHEGASIKHDVAVPVAAVPELLARGSAAVARIVPGARPFPFGHLGDGNIHFNFTQPAGMSRGEFTARSDAVNAAVYDVVLSLGGTISAEHGIGQAKRGLLAKVRSATEIRLMRHLKAALDPNGILNPGKVL